MKIDNKILINFGLRVKEIRKNRGLSQKSQLHKSNLHRTYIGMIEQTEKNITLINIEKLSKALDTPLKVNYQRTYNGK